MNLDGAALFIGYSPVKRHKINSFMGSNSLKLRFYSYDLTLRHVFTISGSSRSVTPVVLVELEYDGVVGYGEASLPPYLIENKHSVMCFLSSLNMSQFSDPFLLDDILSYVDSIAFGNYAAKAAVDIALHDLVGRLLDLPLYRLLGLNADKTPVTSFTIGIDTADVVRQKVIEASPYRLLKVKLGTESDKMMIETIRSVTDKPICVDVNQGWSDCAFALDMIFWLKEKGIVFVEQPMSKSDFDGNAWLTQHSPLPIIADEAVQTIDDVLPLKGAYSGINIKLMKCGGIRNAFLMMKMARSINMKVMIGCMTETSCAISAATQLSPLVDWADLDGNLLIANDIFDGVTVVDGKMVLDNRPGIGVIKIR